jgi:drug/metabolite transporter (DMT)-like permease
MDRSPPSSERCHLLDTPDVREVTAPAVGCDDRDDSSTSRRWWWRSLFGRRKRGGVALGAVFVEDDAGADADDDAASNDDRRADDSSGGRRIRRRRRDDEGGSRWSAVVAGQTIAFALSCANAASSSLANDFRVAVPTLQTGLVYSLLSFRLAYLLCGGRRARERENDHVGSIREHDDNRQAMDDVREPRPSASGGSNDATPPSRRVGGPATGRRRPGATAATPHKFPFTNLILHAPCRTYALLAVLDVEANYLATLSFRRTALSSSMLLTSLSVLSTAALRPLVLPRGGGGIGGRGALGAALCLVGGCSWLRRGVRPGGDGDDRGGDVAARGGDLLALAAACAYGLNDVLAERLLKAGSCGAEYVGMIGLFGAAFSLCVQAPLLGEWDRARMLFGGARDVAGADLDRRYGGVAGSFPDPTTMGAIDLLLLCYVVMLFYFYNSAMAYMSRYDSTSLNLSLQSGPLWAVVLTMIQKSLTAGGNSIAWVGILPPAMFFVSFTLIVVGMFLYESNSENEKSSCIVEDEDGMEGSSICSFAKKKKLDKDYGSNELIESYLF